MPCMCPSLSRTRVHPLPASAGWKALWFSFTKPLSPTNLLSSPSHCKLERKEKNCLLFFVSSLGSWLSVVSVPSGVLPWSTRFWGVGAAAGQQYVKDFCRAARSSFSLLSSVPTEAGDRAVYLLPSQKLRAGGRIRGRKESEMERGEKRDQQQEEKHGKERRALHNLWTCCSQVTFFTVPSFHILLGCSENAPTRKGF